MNKPSKAPKLVARSQSLGRELIMNRHRFVYCGSQCIAYQRPDGAAYRLGAVDESRRTALHEFGCMAYTVVSPDAFEMMLPDSVF